MSVLFPRTTDVESVGETVGGDSKSPMRKALAQVSLFALIPTEKRA